jgi:asparagine synthase (glutamine-hydrolysing)
MDRPKNGFGVPLGKWLRTYLKDEIARVSRKEYIEKQGIFCYDVIKELIDKVEKSDKKPYPKILWAYYIFQLWYTENFE